MNGSCSGGFVGIAQVILVAESWKSAHIHISAICRTAGEENFQLTSGSSVIQAIVSTPVDLRVHVNLGEKQAASAGPGVWIHAGLHLNGDIGDLARVATAETLKDIVNVSVDDAALFVALGTEISLGWSTGRLGHGRY